MPKITKITPRMIFDSRGLPTIEVDLVLEGLAFGRFATPSGASCGSKEALELRDGEKAFLGKGVFKAISNINQHIAPALLERDFATQLDLDQLLIELDGTKNKSHLGANAILSVSGAFFRALALASGKPLYGEGTLMPMPMVNVINGGSHANNGLDIQEFMLVPKGAKSFSKALKMVAEVFGQLKKSLNRDGFSVAVGDEGGFAPKLSSNEEALKYLTKACEEAGYCPGVDIFFALDVAANEIFNKEKSFYTIDRQSLNTPAMLLWYQELVQKYPIISIEDPFHENDYEAFKELTKVLGEKIQIVGDDLFVTNPELIKEGIENKYANAVLIKMNQIGTVSEALEAIKTAKEGGLNTIISHRSGETEDCTIADLAVLTNAGQIKTGSMSRSDRLAKYNQLLRIEEALQSKARF